MSREKDSESADRSWFRQHQGTIREWLVLVVATAAEIFGWLQISDERDARKDAEAEQARAERRAQADEIAVWQIEDRGEVVNVIVANHSHQPVYQVVVSRVVFEGAGVHTGRQIPEEISLEEQQAVLVVPLGRTRLQFPGGFKGMGRMSGFEIAFKDQAGRYWLRYANGSLQEIDRWPIGYYHLDRPVLWR